MALFMGAAAMTSLTSCINDAPEIHASATFTHITDFSGLINAINDNNAKMRVTIDNNGKLIMEAIDRNGEKINKSITEGFTLMQKSINDLGDSIYVTANRQNIAITTLSETTKAGLQELAAKGDKIVLAINENGQTIALAVNNQGEAIKGQILETNTRLAALADSVSRKGDALVVAVGKNTAATNAAGETISKAVYQLNADSKAAYKAISDSAYKNNGRMIAAIDSIGNVVLAAVVESGKATTAGLKTISAALINKQAVYTVSNDGIYAMMTTDNYSKLMNNAAQKSTLKDLLKQTAVSVKYMYSYRHMDNGAWKWTSAADKTAAQAKLSDLDAADLHSCGMNYGQVIVRKMSTKGKVTVKVHNATDFAFGKDANGKDAISFTDATAAKQVVATNKKEYTVDIVFWKNNVATPSVRVDGFAFTNDVNAK